MIGLLVNRSKTRELRITESEMLVEVYGNTEGAITGANRVIVAPTGCCKSSIKADHLDIAGQVFGDVDVEELVIRREGRIHGQVKYKKLALLEGAVFCIEDSAEKTEAVEIETVSELQAVVGLHSALPETQIRKMPLKRQVPPRQPHKAAEPKKSAYQDSTLGGESEGPSFTTSF